MSMRSCNASPNCRIEWRPSRVRAASVVLVAALAAVACALSALPPAWAAAGSLACLLAGLRRARRDLAATPGTLAWPGGDADARWTTVAGTSGWHAVNVRWRGPLATLDARDDAGKLRRLAWWPDTLPPGARRALRLASDQRPARDRAAPSH
jgi:toxin CptA